MSTASSRTTATDQCDCGRGPKAIGRPFCHDCIDAKLRGVGIGHAPKADMVWDGHVWRLEKKPGRPKRPG